ncbi:hypothetical protein BSKO_13306 [Bryopsis sp. KO-2023]|nr:hypothetical protein BSKO_13306 [Bryopsis sp. KO-2023]
MHSTVSTILLVLVALAVSTVARPVKPDFCGSVDCPSYTVLKHELGYELRSYAKGKWATVTLEDSTYSDALGVCFDKLFDYIEGSNVEKRKIPMTAPVLGKVSTAAESFASTGDFEFSFYVPNAAVAPLSGSGISITETPEDFEVYVASFGGYASTSDWKEAASGLKDRLDAAGASYDGSHYFTAGYDSPFHFFHRHNEVWIVKEEKSV